MCVGFEHSFSPKRAESWEGELRDIVSRPGLLIASVVLGQSFQKRSPSAETLRNRPQFSECFIRVVGL